jgi:hypothetical protein
MNWSSILSGLGIGVCTFALVWATARHFTGLDQEHGAALAIAIGAGVLVTLGYILLESRLFDSLRRRGR